MCVCKLGPNARGPSRAEGNDPHPPQTGLHGEDGSQPVGDNSLGGPNDIGG